MKFKLIVAMTENGLTDQAIEAARARGATGATVITSARGEGLHPAQSFFGLTVSGQRDIIFFLVEEHRSREILEAIGTACCFDAEPGTGVAFQVDIEDAVGLSAQIDSIQAEISEEEL